MIASDPPSTSNAERRACVEELFPELNEISSPELRARVVDIWVECWSESEWERLEEAPRYPGTNQLLHTHVRAVTKHAIAVTDTLASLHDIHADRDTVVAAALLHDTSKLLEYAPDGDGAKYATPLIQHGAYTGHKAWKYSLPETLIHAIMSHTRESNLPPKTLEAAIVCYVDRADADFLRFSLGQPMKISRPNQA